MLVAKEKDVWLLQLVCYNLAYLSQGLILGSLGPTLPFLAAMANHTPVIEYGTIFSSSGIGAMLSIVLFDVSPFVWRSMRGHVLLGSLSFGLLMLCCALPFVARFGSVVVSSLFLVKGFLCALINLLVNRYCDCITSDNYHSNIDQNKKKKKKILHSLNISFGIGTVLGPLLTVGMMHLTGDIFWCYAAIALVSGVQSGLAFYTDCPHPNRLIKSHGHDPSSSNSSSHEAVSLLANEHRNIHTKNTNWNPLHTHHQDQRQYQTKQQQQQQQQLHRNHLNRLFREEAERNEALRKPPVLPSALSGGLFINFKHDAGTSFIHSNFFDPASNFLVLLGTLLATLFAGVQLGFGTWSMEYWQSNSDDNFLNQTNPRRISTFGLSFNASALLVSLYWLALLMGYYIIRYLVKLTQRPGIILCLQTILCIASILVLLNGVDAKNDAKFSSHPETPQGPSTAKALEEDQRTSAFFANGLVGVLFFGFSLSAIFTNCIDVLYRNLSESVAQRMSSMIVFGVGCGECFVPMLMSFFMGGASGSMYGSVAILYVALVISVFMCLVSVFLLITLSNTSSIIHLRPKQRPHQQEQ